ncbi:MAG: penicillin-binding protein [Actinomycetales bacterium]|nr:penicillin-binding protein [Actinomycetales bacterium]
MTSQQDRDTADSRAGLLIKMAIFIGLAGLITGIAAIPVVGTVGLVTRNSATGFSQLPSDLTEVPLPLQNTITDAEGNVIATLFSQDRIEVPLDEIAPVMQKAIIDIEDQRFFQHAGIDIRGTLRALISTGSGTQVQGGSTITQQYVKQILLAAAQTPEEQKAATEPSLARKIREARYAIGLENKLSKQQILQGYLNIAYFGSGAYGVEAAARRYFSTSASELNLTQAATLAGLVQSPSRFDPTQFPLAGQQRRNEVIQAMLRAGDITAQEADVALARPIESDLNPSTIPNGCTSSSAPFFCDFVLTILRDDPAFGATPEIRSHLLDVGGLTIRTTLSPKAQFAAQRSVNRYIPIKDPSKKATSITMIKPGTGEIVAMAQNRLWGTSGLGFTTINYGAGLANNGTVGFQAGSTFKPFTIAAALKQRISPYKYISSPSGKTFYNFRDCATGNLREPWTVQNSTSSGTFNMLQATAYSVNTYFVGLEEQTGICDPPAVAKSLGVTLGNGQDIPQLPCFTLGCFDVTTLDMAEAMATFAGHGIHCSPIAIISITDRNGQALDVPSAGCAQALDSEVADSVAAILAGVIDGPLGGRTGAQMYFDRPAAGKTGTTDNHAAVWFVGFTPDLAAAVWVGDPRGGQQFPMSNVTINGTYYSQVYGYLLPGPIWRDSMAGALKGTPKTKWNLKTLFGLNPGGYGNYGQFGLCPNMAGEELNKCNAANNFYSYGDFASARPTPAVQPTLRPGPTVRPTKTGAPTVAPTTTPEPTITTTPSP